MRTIVNKAFLGIDDKVDDERIQKAINDIDVDPYQDLKEGIFVFRKKNNCCQIPVDEEEYLKHYSSADVIEYLVQTNERLKIKE
jgi:hypothetical protein